MATTAVPAVEHYDLTARRWFILIGLITAAIMEVLDTTIVNVALPQMAGNLSATTDEIGWVATGYILSNVVVLPMTAFFTQLFGRRNYLVGSIVIFVIASFLCGTSHSLGELVLWRVVQGAGGAALLSTAQATLRQVFPPREQAMVQALFIVGLIVAPTIGPTLGGWITDNYNWNWIFFINIPIGIVTIFLTMTFLQDPPGSRRRPERIDFLGIGLLTVGLASLQYVLEEGRRYDWFQDDNIKRLSVLAAVCLSTMLWWELSPRNKHPIVDFRVLRNRQLAASIFLFVALGFGLYGGVFIFPLFTQTILGFSPTATGLALLPGGIGTAITAIICGRLLSGNKVDGRILIALGIVIFSSAMWRLGHLTTEAGEPQARAALFIRGLGLGLLFTPINNVAFGGIEAKDAQQSAGLINLARQLGGSFGIAILSTYVQDQTQFHRVNLVQYVTSYNPQVAARTSAIATNFVAHGFSYDAARHAAVGALDNIVTRQSAMMAYNDAWLMILLVFVFASPAILLLRRPRASAGAGAGAGH